MAEAGSSQEEREQNERKTEFEIGVDMIKDAQALIGLKLTPEERELMRNGVNQNLQDYEQLRTVELPNHVMPALRFDPRPANPESQKTAYRRPLSVSPVQIPEVPTDLEGLAFLPVTHLSQLVRARKITSTQLTKMYLKRLKRYDPVLECVVTFTEELALELAGRADDEIASGIYRGPLHGIPWGAKDLLATKGIPTTWGAPPYKEQVLDLDATVVRRLEAAGAVLVAKLSMGSLAWGDVWFGGRTKSPWNLEEGSSGSSAGSGSATAAGLVGFAIGTETFGSIVSPSTQCGVSGLRPTFGRVSRHGAMALCWSLDKIGPMCRSVEDCALVFDAIRGADGYDPTVVDKPFEWPQPVRFDSLRIGYVQQAFEQEYETREQDLAALDILRSLGADLIPIELPDYPVDALKLILWVEAAAAFDDLTRSNRDDLLVRQGEESWPNRMRVARMVPAVEYIQANRIRTLVIEAMADLMSNLDLYVAPSLTGSNMWITNATGHPAVVVPDGFRENNLPSTITFTGQLYGEAILLAVARAYQDATDFHLKHPVVFSEQSVNR